MRDSGRCGEEKNIDHGISIYGSLIGVELDDLAGEVVVEVEWVRDGAFWFIGC